MRSVLLILLWVLFAAAQVEQPTGGYCIGNLCFALFEATSDFEGAEDSCGQHRGHLMTVRSSVAHDTLTLLLSNKTGLHWIGLHLPKGCPDPSSELQGYQWITTDTSSNFYNWAETSPFGDTCSPFPRCIAVSKDNKFKWQENNCKDKIDGFLCEYTFQEGGCQAFQNTDAFYITPYGFRVQDAVTLPQGTVAEHPDETKQICVSGQWIRAPWSCEIQKGGCEHRCTVDPENKPVCYCQPGFTINPANDLTCEAAVDDPCIKLQCAHACYKYSDSFLCTCHEGFVLGDDKKSCVDLNECSDERQCQENQKCINTQGWFKCICKDGYRLKGGKCEDIDECESAPCEQTCNNKPGGYDCLCEEGYKPDPQSPNLCKRFCGKEECVAECDPNNKYQCFCPEGYIREERADYSVCIDMDECESYSNCDQYCENSFGSYQCFCDPGYTLVDNSRCEQDKSVTIGVTDFTEAATVAPEHRPSGVSVGAFVGIIICTVFFTVLAVFLINHVLCGQRKTDRPETLKASESHETNNLPLTDTVP